MSTCSPYAKREFYNSRYFTFHSRNQGIDLGQNYQFTLEDPFAISVWVKDFPLSGTVFSSLCTPAPYKGFLVDFSGDQIRVFAAKDWSLRLGGYAFFNHGMAPGIWYNVVVSFRALGISCENISLYINGIRKRPVKQFNSWGSGDTVEYLPGVNSVIGYKATNRSACPVGAKINDVSFWSDYFKDEHAVEIYNSGESLNLNKHSRNKELIGWYRFERIISNDPNYVHNDKDTGHGVGMNLSLKNILLFE